MQTGETFDHGSSAAADGRRAQDGGSGNNTSCISHSILSAAANGEPGERAGDAGKPVISPACVSHQTDHTGAGHYMILQYIL